MNKIKYYWKRSKKNKKLASFQVENTNAKYSGIS